eukprot:20682-Heterococcus_DN1.PRE.2
MRAVSCGFSLDRLSGKSSLSTTLLCISCNGHNGEYSDASAVYGGTNAVGGAVAAAVTREMDDACIGHHGVAILSCIQGFRHCHSSSQSQHYRCICYYHTHANKHWSLSY